jgi:hypothetical protein
VGGATGPQRTLADYAGKILVVFQLGHNCPVCLNDGPSVEADLWQHYQTAAPGKVQVIGADMWDGTPGQLQTFKNVTGATYPLLLMGSTPATGSLQNWGPWDNYVIVSADGIVRFNAVQQGYAHGNRYQLNRMRALIDSLIMTTLGVGDPPAGAAGMLRASPNPAAGAVSIELRPTSGDGPAPIVAVSDVAGRVVARLAAAGASDAGVWRYRWDGRDRDGRALPAGIYLVNAEVGGRRLARRLVLAR